MTRCTTWWSTVRSMDSAARVPPPVMLNLWPLVLCRGYCVVDCRHTDARAWQLYSHPHCQLFHPRHTRSCASCCFLRHGFCSEGSTCMHSPLLGLLRSVQRGILTPTCCAFSLHLPLSQCVDVAVEDLPLQMPAILASMKDVCKSEPMYFLHYL